MQPRQLEALGVQLRSSEFLSVIIRPSQNQSRFFRLAQAHRTWMTAQAGDEVLLKKADSSDYDRFVIESIVLYRATPEEFNGQTVTTAQSWLNGSE